jgi:hypothetical protein
MNRIGTSLRSGVEQIGKGGADEIVNFLLAILFSSGIELAEALEDLGGFEMKAFDLVIVCT